MTIYRTGFTKHWVLVQLVSAFISTAVAVCHDIKIFQSIPRLIIMCVKDYVTQSITTTFWVTL